MPHRDHVGISPFAKVRSVAGVDNCATMKGFSECRGIEKGRIVTFCREKVAMDLAKGLAWVVGTTVTSGDFKARRMCRDDRY